MLVIIHKGSSLFPHVYTSFSVKFCFAGPRSSLSSKIILLQVMGHTIVMCVIRVSYYLAFSSHTFRLTKVRNHSDVTFAVKVLHDGIILLHMHAYTVEISLTSVKCVPKALTGIQIF